MISPAEFVPVAEESGLIEQIGEWVIRTACREAGRLLRLTGNLPRVAVNVSPQQFRRPDLFDTIRDALDQAALDPSYLEVEITEGALLGDVDQALETLHALRELGVGNCRRRLRHGLFQPRVFDAFSVEPPEDRPLVRRAHGQRSAKSLRWSARSSRWRMRSSCASRPKASKHRSRRRNCRRSVATRRKASGFRGR